jgi:hypothetical protein
MHEQIFLPLECPRCHKMLALALPTPRIYAAREHAKAIVAACAFDGSSWNIGESDRAYLWKLLEEYERVRELGRARARPSPISHRGANVGDES